LFELDMGKLEGSFGSLTSADHKAVQDAVGLIKDGQHSLALVRLFELNDRNPENSSLRILASYALLQAGNLAGAFDEAQKAHEVKDQNAYKCWYLGKVALLNGKKEVCQREIGHVHGSGNQAGADELRKEMSSN